MNFTDYVIPVIIAAILLWGLIKKTDVFGDFIDGAKEGAMVCFDILPSLVALMTCTGMMQQSGLIEVISSIFEPLTNLIGFPKECTGLALMRPISGSGALSLLEGILKESGADSFAGRVASVLMGSTETTFYVIAVYFGAVRIKKTRHCVTAALSADITGVILSALAVRFFL